MDNGLECVIRFEVERMKSGMIAALRDHQGHLESEVNKAVAKFVEDFDFEQEVKSYLARRLPAELKDKLNWELSRAVDRALRDPEIKSAFASLVADELRKRLEL